MTATLWVSIILGAGGLIGGTFTAIAKLRDWRSDKVKKHSEIKLDAASYHEIASRAAKINSEERIETERWWKEQFDAVKVELKETREELEIQRAWRKKITRRLRVHQEWDHEAAMAVPGLREAPSIIDEEDEL